MATYQVLMHVPEAIHRGLSGGSLMRDAAGIVRTTAGSHPGSIVAHLREVGQASAVQPSLAPALISTGALAAIQIASTIYLSRKLDKIEALTRHVLTETQKVLTTVSEIREELYRDKARNFWRALEFYRLWARAGRDGDLQKALEHFVQGKADIIEVVGRMGSESLIENPERSGYLLSALTMNAGGQMMAMAHLEYPADALRAEVDDYRGLLGLKANELRAAPAPRNKMPTFEMLAATRETGGPVVAARNLRRSLDAVRDSLEAEVQLGGGILDLPRKELQSFSHRLEAEGSADYCALRPGSI
jgi:hypothetical protein